MLTRPLIPGNIYYALRNIRTGKWSQVMRLLFQTCFKSYWFPVHAKISLFVYCIWTLTLQTHKNNGVQTGRYVLCTTIIFPLLARVRSHFGSQQHLFRDLFRWRFLTGTLHMVYLSMPGAHLIGKTNPTFCFSWLPMYNLILKVNRQAR